MGNFRNELKEYQTIPRKLIFDNNMSDRARFLFCYMASKPDDWDFFLEPMAKELGYSTETLRKYINELITNGWLIKGNQENESGKFGAVKYTLKARKDTPSAKNTEAEKIRHGKNPTQHNKDNNIIDNTLFGITIIEKEKISKKEKDELFEKCWIAYHRKGRKKQAKMQWDKLTDDEKSRVQNHIKAYTSEREIQYQQDFERYLRDKTFNTVVYGKGNKVIYDPSNENQPQSNKCQNNGTVIIGGQTYK